MFSAKYLMSCLWILHASRECWKLSFSTSSKAGYSPIIPFIYSLCQKSFQKGPAASCYWLCWDTQSWLGYANTAIADFPGNTLFAIC